MNGIYTYFEHMLFAVRPELYLRHGAAQCRGDQSAHDRVRRFAAVQHSGKLSDTF